MTDFLSVPAKICLAATAFLIRDGRILLVKHKKLGIWLAPGGHVEDDELPHRAAERECREETGIEVQARSAMPLLSGTTSQYFPVPFAVNLHWISPANYRARQDGPTPAERIGTPLWPRGCEQHLAFCYLVSPVAGVAYTQNPAETDGIQWFTSAEVDRLETTPDIKGEIHRAFTLAVSP